MLPVETLEVFQRAYQCSFRVQELSLQFPRIEQYKGLASQIRDSSKSVVFNLVEGYSFKTRRVKRFINHLEISIGSCDETRIGLRYGYELGYIEAAEYKKLVSAYDEIGKMLWGLLKSVE